MEKVIDNLRIPILTKDDIANYIEMVFNSDIYISKIKECKSRDLALLFYRNIGKILMAYITSTGDLKQESAIKIISSYYNFINKNNNEFSVANFYMENVFPLTLEKLGYNSENLLQLPISKVLEIEKHIALIYDNNRFYTHSFNGALYEKINARGLDIKSELFEEEFSSLTRLTGQTPFKVGKLFYTELGAHSFQYATKSPERLGMMLSTSIEHEDGETLEQYYRKCLEKRLSDSCLTDNEKVVIRENVNKMLNFYYGQHKSCIAIFKGKNSDIIPNYISTLYTSILSLKSKIYTLLKNDEELKARYQLIEENFKKVNPSSLAILEDFKKYCLEKYPNNKIIDNLINNHFFYTIPSLVIPTLTYEGNGDGYLIPSGKLDRELISIATIDNIYDLYASKKAEQKQEEKRQQDLLVEVKRLLNTDLGDSYYAVDPNKYNGIPYLVKKDVSFLTMEEGQLYQKLEQLWYDGVIDLKKKSELYSVLHSEYERMKKQAPKKSANEEVDILEKMRKIVKKKYGYYEKSNEEKAKFDEQLERMETEAIKEIGGGRFRETLESMGLNALLKENLEQSLFHDDSDYREVEQKPRRIM